MPSLKTICIAIHAAAWRELRRPATVQTCLGAFLVLGLLAIGALLRIV